jgi:hypothetical protein
MTKTKAIIGALLGIAACSSMAGVVYNQLPVACPEFPTVDELVNSCSPEVTFYMGGAIYQQEAIDRLMMEGNTIFDRNKLIAKVYDTSNGPTSANTVGYIGFGAPETAAQGQRLLVLVSSKLSVPAINELMGTPGSFLSQPMLMTSSVRNLVRGVRGSCVVISDDEPNKRGLVTCHSTLPFNVGWSLDRQTRMHMALSELRPSELSPGTVPRWNTQKIASVSTAMQGFAVIVNPSLYQLLQQRDVASGRISPACMALAPNLTAPTVEQGLCEPNLSSVDYASVLGGSVKGLNALLGVGRESARLVLVNWVKESGRRAVADIRFAGQSGYNSRAPDDDGFMDVLSAGIHGRLVVREVSLPGDMASTVSGSTELAMGVIPLSAIKGAGLSSLKGALPVKLDGISAVSSAAGEFDPNLRVGLRNGYTFAFEMQAVYPTTLANPYAAIAQAIVQGLSDPQYNTPGYAYIGMPDAQRHTPYSRAGNNYGPLLMTHP